MKKLVVALFFLLSSVVTVSAQSNMCNQKCDVDSDCGSGYRCYVGVCRLNSCPAASSCVCNGASPTPTPKATATARPTSTPVASISATVKPSPTPIATMSGTLKQSPKTGFESWVLAGGAVILFAFGSVLHGSEKVLATRKLSPRDLVKQRQSSST